MNQPHPKQGGFTMIELMVALSVFGLMSALFFKFILSSSYGLTHVENSTDLIRLAQRVRQNLAQTVGSSQLLIAESPTASGLMTPYQTLIDTSRNASSTGAPAPVMPTQPKIVDASTIDQTLGGSFGNELMLACVITPLKLSVTITTTPLYVANVNLDRYQFVHLYLATQPGVPLANFGSPAPSYGAMGLVEWRSKPFVSYGELSNLGNKMNATCTFLSGIGYTSAWDSSQTDPSKAFHTISSSSPFIATAASPSTLGEQSWAWVTDFSFAEILNPDPLKPNKKVVTADHFGQSNFYISRYSIAYNTITSTAAAKVNSLYGDYGINLGVPRIATPLSGGFPGGFEVIIAGSSGSRLVYIRGVLMASSGTEQTLKAYRATEFESVNTVSNTY